MKWIAAVSMVIAIAAGVFAFQRVQAASAAALLRRNLLIYGLGGLLVPFIGIKLIDMAVAAIGLA